MTIRGDFADSARVPTSVFAVEAERQAEVKHGAFALRGLSAGPVTLRLVNGADTMGVLALSSLPGGSVVDLQRLRVDRATHLAFPEAVGLTGPELVTMNGVRMGSAARLPADVNAHGRVLSVSPEHDALLLRPDDGALPDLRVVVGLATEAVTDGGDSADAGRVRAGDSVRVQGHADHGFVVATRLVVPRRLAAALPPPPPAVSAETAPDRSPDEPQVEVRVRLPREVQEVIDGLDGRGRGRGHGRGKGNRGGP